MLLALLLLVVVTAIGGWFLLRGERVDLKANKKLPEKIASGKDIKQAAFDSISGSLTPLKAGDTSTGVFDASGGSRFNPRPPLLAGDTRTVSGSTVQREAFQSAPAIAGGRYP